ncbi:hypothetical protein [Massilia sp. CF038]|uniref:hypothetical protein n=1 Tax=Massilia sp. CF038 TaxID=1881045 RepID=UPI0009191CA6|nr:hypothetical protein [Massilia sp. CF038]SHH08643.1 hypothetical protein SAMN05428948_2701 [Massilia sp. CF038]
MFRPSLLRTASALMAIGLFSFCGTVHASGGDGYIANRFMPEHYVAVAELQDYATGRLGVVVPSYWRVYHFLAYRALTGHALSKAELATLKVDGFNVGDRPGGWEFSSEDENGIAAWKKARLAIKGAAPVEIGIAAEVGDFNTIFNCPSDAFDRASKTLAQRLTQGGPQLAAVWLANQDAVFANCSPTMPQAAQNTVPLVRPLILPPALPPKSPVWLQKDYAYQRAAAHFYAGRYADARTQFLAIAGDTASPWQPLGKYLAARALIRSATAVPGAPETDADKRLFKERLGQARTEMAAIGATYAPAKALVSWIDVRLRPEERRRELSAALAVDPITAATPQMLTDYLVLMDGLEAKLASASDPVTAWIGVMQAGAVDPYSSDASGEAAKRRSDALALARAQWDKGHETVWLVAVLTNARSTDLKPAERKAASAIKADSPAYVTLQYHLARMALAEGKAREADAIVSALLKTAGSVSTRNRLLRLKMVSAPSADAALAAAARTPAEQEEGVNAAPQFDADLRAHLELHLPLTALVRLKPSLPASEQASSADMIWTRAVLLGQYAVADGLTDEVAKTRASTRHLYERFKKATTPEAKRDAALLILANAPELVPHVGTDDKSYGRSDYWACYGSQAGDDGMDLISPAFLTAEERTQVEKEKAQLRKLPRRSSYLIPQVIEWARQNKADPEAPKALHFLIASTRNECSAGAPEAAAPKYSKQAFEFLHKQFPKSEWTAKTRYYY